MSQELPSLSPDACRDEQSLRCFVEASISPNAWPIQSPSLRRPLTRRFEAKVGKSPREFVRLGRFALAWQTAAAQPRATWATVAAEAGYADPPHLDRDFRLLAGAAPTRVFAEGRDVNTASCPIRSSRIPSPRRRRGIDAATAPLGAAQ
jgi:AraC-like DNA-binding protein